MLPVLARGRAYLLAEDAHGAIAEFQKMLQHRGLLFKNPEGALARLGLARVCSFGDKVMASAHIRSYWNSGKAPTPIFRSSAQANTPN